MPYHEKVAATADRTAESVDCILLRERAMPGLSALEEFEQGERAARKHVRTHSQSMQGYEVWLYCRNRRLTPAERGAIVAYRAMGVSVRVCTRRSDGYHKPLKRLPKGWNLRPGPAAVLKVSVKRIGVISFVDHVLCKDPVPNNLQDAYDTVRSAACRHGQGLPSGTTVQVYFASDESIAEFAALDGYAQAGIRAELMCYTGQPERPYQALRLNRHHPVRG